MMIKLNKKQGLKVVKSKVKTLYRLKPEVKKMNFNNNLKLAYYKTISEKMRNKNWFY